MLIDAPHYLDTSEAHHTDRCSVAGVTDTMKGISWLTSR